MLRDPLTGPKTIALLATVGQARVCVFVFVSVCVCCEERRCGGVTLKSPKKHISLHPQSNAISLKHNKLNFKHVIRVIIPRTITTLNMI